MKRTWTVRGVLIPAVVVLLTVSCGGGSAAKSSPTSAETPAPSAATAGADSPAAHAMKQLLDVFSRQDWNAAYDLLHPAERKLVDRDLFVRCSKQGSNSPPTFTDVRVTREVTEHNTAIPGTDVKQDSQLLTVEVNANGSPLKQDMHQYSVTASGIGRPPRMP